MEVTEDMMLQFERAVCWKCEQTLSAELGKKCRCKMALGTELYGRFVCARPLCVVAHADGQDSAQDILAVQTPDWRCFTTARAHGKFPKSEPVCLADLDTDTRACMMLQAWQSEFNIMHADSSEPVLHVDCPEALLVEWAVSDSGDLD